MFVGGRKQVPGEPGRGEGEEGSGGKSEEGGQEGQARRAGGSGSGRVTLECQFSKSSFNFLKVSIFFLACRFLTLCQGYVYLCQFCSKSLISNFKRQFVIVCQLFADVSTFSF